MLGLRVTRLRLMLPLNAPALIRRLNYGVYRGIGAADYGGDRIGFCASLGHFGWSIGEEVAPLDAYWELFVSFKWIATLRAALENRGSVCWQYCFIWADGYYHIFEFQWRLIDECGC